MSPQIGHLHKLTVTMGATVGFLTGVQTHMGLEMMVTREALMTDFALEGLFTGMGSLVVLKNVLVAKGSVANLACEDLVAPVHAILAGPFHGHDRGRRGFTRRNICGPEHVTVTRGG